MGNEPDHSVRGDDGTAAATSPGEKEEEGSQAPHGVVMGRQGAKYQEKHKHIRGRGLISSSALGVTDGLVTNLAFLTGLGEAVSSIDLIRVAGLAAMVAGAISMFFGGILGARSESDLFKADSEREAFEIEHERDEEITELKSLYREKGLTEAEAEMVVARVSASRETFLEDMLANELHVHESVLQNVYKVGAVIGASFLVGALVPLLPYYVLPTRSYAIVGSASLSLAFLFLVGLWKGRVVSAKSKWRSGVEALTVGAVATAILYAVGSLIGFV